MGGGKPHPIYNIPGGVSLYLSLSVSMYISPIWYMPNLWSISP